MSLPTIAVTALNATDNPGPGVAVLRSLRAADGAGRLIGLTYDALDAGVYAADIADDVYLIPYPSLGTEALQLRLEHIFAHAPVDVIIPTLDSELVGFLKLEAFMKSRGTHMFAPTREQLDLRAKTHLAELGAGADIPVPPQCTINDVDELYRLKDVSFPLFVKGQFYGAIYAGSVDEAIAAFHHTVAKWGLPVILQQRVVGEEVDVAAVGDGRGGLVGAVPMKKTLLTDKGKGWAGIVLRDPELDGLVRKFMAFTRWRGPCELEFVRTTDGYRLLEVNPRFPAWIYLSAGAGVNLPWAVARLALGLEPPPFHLEVGTMFVRISLDQIVPIEQFATITQEGELHRGAPASAPDTQETT
jgi:carbamoyl-phosphate synthase large subunit